jgi:nucleoside-diphosphate-sugar epimerase
MARVLVTGGGGFLGGAIVAALAARGDEVIAFDVAFRQPASPQVTRVAGSVTEWPQLARAIADHRPDKVVHCAAIVGVLPSIDAPLATMRVNVEGSLNLLEAMRLSGIRRVVHISSDEVYGPFESTLIGEDHPCRPLMAYGISKYAVEQLGRSYAALYGLECINLRTCWVYGHGLPRARVPNILVDAALGGRPLHLPSGADFRVDQVYIDDTVQGVLLALDHEAHAFDAYNIATGQAPSLADIVAIIKELVPGADLSVGPGAFRYNDALAPVAKGALDIERAKRHLGYAPRYDIRAGLAAHIEAAQRGEH